MSERYKILATHILDVIMDVPENPQRETARRVSDAVREVITTAGGSTCPEVVN